MTKNRKSKPLAHHADPTLLFNICQVNASAGIKMLFSLLLLSAAVSSVFAGCAPPKGSYQDTCKVKGTAYVSTDLNLKSVEMCKFDLDCLDMKGSPSPTTFYVQSSMSACLTFFENCNGKPVIRGSNERICTTEESIIRESKSKLEL